MILVPMLINDPRFKQLRRNLRNNPTPWEHRLWLHLNRRQVMGLKFRRQIGIGEFIVDFYCPKLKFIIELDGSGHLDTAQAKADKERDTLLSENGFTVARYLNSDIDENLEGVLEDISVKCELLRSSSTSP